MNLPNSITPNRIKNSILEVFFDSNEPFEILFGYFYNNVLENGTYKSIELSNDNSSSEDNNSKNILFYNETIKFVFSESSLIINCNDKYENWLLYFDEIKNVINFFNFEKEIIINKIGLRYISEYPNMDLRDNIKFEFKFGFPNISSNSYSFNTEFNYNDALIILTLRNQIPFNVNNKEEKINLSIIDIDVIQDNLNLNIKEIENIYKKIETNHLYEKEIFFNILNESFLKSLNPQY